MIRDDSGRTAGRCSTCSGPLADPELLYTYPNPICGNCDGRAVPTEPAEVPSGRGPTTGAEATPVLVDGHRCWRREVDGGHVTLRDAHDCATFEQFRERHYDAHGAPIQSFSRPPMDTPSERARWLEARSKEAPSALDVAEIHAVLDSSSSDARATALKALKRCLAERPAAGAPMTDRLADALRNDAPRTAVYALSCLVTVAEAEPAAAADAAPAVVPFLDSDNRTVRQYAAAFFRHVVTAEAGAAFDAVPLLATLLDEPSTARNYALYALSRVAAEYPEEVLPTVSTLVRLLDDADPDGEPTATVLASSALGRVASAYPETATPALPALVDCFAAGDARIRNNAVGILGELATQRSDCVEPYVDVIVALLDDADEQVRTNASAALARVARRNPDAVADYCDRLSQLLDEPDAQIRVHACWALGFCQALRSADRLRDVSLADPNPGVRERAEWALNRIE